MRPYSMIKPNLNLEALGGSNQLVAMSQTPRVVPAAQRPLA